MKKYIFLFLAMFLCNTLNAQLPPPPPLQPGEHWTNLWSVSYDFQTNGSLRYLVQNPSDSHFWCAILMAQHDSINALGVQRYIYYAYSDNDGVNWTEDVLNNSSSFGFPCITLKNNIPVIACHKSSSLGSFVFSDLLFGGFAFSQVGIIPVSSTPPIWPHIAGSTNGNLILAASPNPGLTGARTTFNGSLWSTFTDIPLISGPAGNFEVAAGPNGKVSIIGSDYNFENALSWYRSNNNGATFDAGEVIMQSIVDGEDLLYANVRGGYQAVYDINGNAHIIFAAYNINSNAVLPDYTTAYIKPRIYHWSSETNTFTQIAGKASIPNLLDTITQSNNVPLCHPTISVTANGKLKCAFTAYLRGNTQVVQNGTVVNAGEIFISVSNDNGISWQSPQNITNTPNIEEKYPSLSPNTSYDSLRIYYIRDMRAGEYVTASEWGKAPVYGIFNNGLINSIPPAPVLYNPPNNSNNISLTPLLDWNDVFTVESYRVQLSKNAGFTVLIIDQSGLISSQYQIPTSILNNDSVYYWRVNAVNSIGTGSWSPVFNFRTISVIPYEPELVTPSNGSVNNTLTPTLEWNDVVNANSYNVQISTRADFSSLLLNQQNIIPSQYSVPSSMLSYDSVYYWRVSGTNTFGTGQWSSVWNFRTLTFLPNAPILISPANNSSNISLTPTLDWNDVFGVISYKLQISTDTLFTSFILNISDINVSQYIIPASVLSSSTRYYWRVNASNSNGQGQYSIVWNFITAGVPIAPALVSPLNGSAGISITPLLDWDNTPSTISYRVRVATDSVFSNIIFDQSNITVSQITIPSPILTYNSKYYWHVNATNTYGEGPWSANWNFTTILIPVPSAPVLYSPPNNSIGNSTTPLLDWSTILTAEKYSVNIATDLNFNTIIYEIDTVYMSEFRIPAFVLIPNGLYFWRVNAVNGSGTSPWSVTWLFRTGLTNIQLFSFEIPNVYKLYNNYPNPFNPNTKIRFDLPVSNSVKIIVYDLTGREVWVLINEFLQAGSYITDFNGKDLPSGVYYFRLESGNFIKTNRMVLVK